MKCIVNNNLDSKSLYVLECAEEKYNIKIREDIKDFMVTNAGGYPIKNLFLAEDEEYEMRVFLSLDEKNENYYVSKPMDYFLNKTNGKILPIGIDSSDNYYCVNNETGKVYYWSAGEDLYFCLANSLEEFTQLFV